MMMMRGFLAAFGTAVALLSTTTVCWGQEFNLANIGKIYKAEAYYEYNADGVPLIGLVTARLKDNLVKFTSCNNTTLELDFKQLKRSEARCPGSNRDPGPWTTASKSILPLLKVGPSSSTTVQFQGAEVDLSALPTAYKDFLTKAKPGEPVGFAFTGENGEKSLAIIANAPARGGV